MQPTQKLTLPETGLEIKNHLIQRFEAWCKYKGYTIKLVKNEKTSLESNKPSKNLFQKIVHPLKTFCSKPSESSIQDKKIADAFPTWCRMLNGKPFNIPSDIVKIILGDCFPVQSKWRCICKNYRDFIDTQTSFWRNLEKAIIATEYPKAILEGFKGAENIQNLPILPTAVIERKAAITPGVTIQGMKVAGYIRQINPKYITNSVMRGIDNLGRHILFFVVLNQTTQKKFVLAVHENLPALLPARDKEKMGWIASYNSEDAYNTPWADEICFLDKDQETLVSPNFVAELKQFLSGETFRKEIGDSTVKGTCDFKKA